MVIASRELQVRYIWIDALCIVQDDLEGWQKECARMADIYRNAVVTIAARNSAGCRSSFLGRENPVRLRCQVRGINAELLEIGAWYMDPETDCSLASRGRIFQERHLSQRILYFGKYKLSWECATHECYENLKLKA